MGFYLRISFFFLLQILSFYILILISTLAELRGMQIQILTIINYINKHNKRDYTYFCKVRYLEYVINYSFRRRIRKSRNLHGKPQVTRSFATLGSMENRLKETNLLCMNFTKVKYVFVGSTWKRYKNFPIDGANASGV